MNKRPGRSRGVYCFEDQYQIFGVVTVKVLL